MCSAIVSPPWNTHTHTLFHLSPVFHCVLFYFSLFIICTLLLSQITAVVLKVTELMCVCVRLSMWRMLRLTLNAAQNYPSHNIQRHRCACVRLTWHSTAWWRLNTQDLTMSFILLLSLSWCPTPPLKVNVLCRRIHSLDSCDVVINRFSIISDQSPVDLWPLDFSKVKRFSILPLFGSLLIG